MLSGLRLGDDTKGWKGAGVEIYSELVSFQGQKMDGLRIRVAKAPVLNDEVPF